MKKQNVTPEQMTIICNIQMMYEKQNKSVSFNELSKLGYDQLFDLQNKIIKEYNAYLFE